MSVILETEVEFSVICLICGEDLETDVAKKHKNGMPPVIDIAVVAPCKKCNDNLYDKGYVKGHREGYAEGRRDTCEAATALLGATP